jgi:putative MATE family efflux protein
VLDRTIFSVLLFSLGLSAVLTVLGYPLADRIVGLFGVEPSVHALALGYLRILLGGITFTICLFLVNAILRSLGDAITPFVVLVVATLLNLVLDRLLIFGWGTLPAMGVEGAAIASVAARGTGLVLALLFLSRRHMPRPAVSLSYLSPLAIWRILVVGIPSSLSLMARHVSGFVITLVVVRFGTEAVAAYGVCQRITFLVLMPGFGFAIAAAVLVGQSLGAGDPTRARRAAWISVATYAALVVAAAAALLAFPGRIVALFDASPGVVDIGRAYFLVNAPALLALPLGLVLSRAMSGAGYTFWPMVVSMLLLLGLRLPMAWLLSVPLGMDGVFLAVALPLVLESAAMTLLFRRGAWRAAGVS